MYYVGSTLNFDKRICSYFDLKDKGMAIVKALAKYGFSSFTLVLVFIPNCTKEEVLALEQEILDTVKPEYNICPTAGSTAGTKLTKEDRAKLPSSACCRAVPLSGPGRPTRWVRPQRKGQTHSEETKANIAEAQKGNKNAKRIPVNLYTVSPKG